MKVKQQLLELGGPLSRLLLFCLAAATTLSVQLAALSLKDTLSENKKEWIKVKQQLVEWK